MHFPENTLFDIFPLPRNVAQYHLHHVTYAATKFKVAAANGLGDTFTRNRTHKRTRMDIRTGSPRQIHVPFFLQEKACKMYILRIRLQYFKGDYR